MSTDLVPATHESQIGTRALTCAEPWAEKITQAWNKSVQSIVEAGQHLCQAKDALDWDEWRTLLALLPFGKRTVERLMAIGRSPLIAEHLNRLPPHWPTLYELARLDEQTFVSALEVGAIHSDMQRSEVARLESAGSSNRARSCAKAKPTEQECDAAPESAYDAVSIANSYIAHLSDQLRYLPLPVASEVEAIILHWLHERVEGHS